MLTLQILNLIRKKVNEPISEFYCFFLSIVLVSRSELFQKILRHTDFTIFIEAPNQKHQPDVALAVSLLSLSSAMLSFTPLPLGRDTYALVPLPMMKTLCKLQK